MKFNLIGTVYTWINDDLNHTFEKLDRFLVSSEWEEQYQMSIVTTLDIGLSDHAPLILDTGKTTPRNVPFRFENAWTKRGGFFELVKSISEAPVMEVNVLMYEKLN